MAWECGCGISNPNEAVRCAGCGFSREESQQYLLDVEAQQPVKEPNNNGKHKWGGGRIILMDLVCSTLIVGLFESKSPDPLIFLILVFIIILIWPSGT
jgi:hypothetical protein